MAAPLADRVRPATLDEVVGQRHILGPGRALRKIIEAGEVPNMVFYGPAGVGKTTVASIIAKNTKRHLVKLNGTTASTADIKAVVASTNTFEGLHGVLLYLDEIQYFNKKQQQTLLEFMENGSITLIASTTENPYFYVYNAILSRSTVFEFKPVESAEIQKAVERAFRFLGLAHRGVQIPRTAAQLRRHLLAGAVLDQTAGQLRFHAFRFRAAWQQQGAFHLNQVRGHINEFAGDFQLIGLHGLDGGSILLNEFHDIDIIEVHFIFANQIEQQIQRTFKIIFL